MGAQTKGGCSDPAPAVLRGASSGGGAARRRPQLRKPAARSSPVRTRGTLPSPEGQDALETTRPNPARGCEEGRRRAGALDPPSPSCSLASYFPPGLATPGQAGSWAEPSHHWSPTPPSVQRALGRELGAARDETRLPAPSPAPVAEHQEGRTSRIPSTPWPHPLPA